MNEYPSIEKLTAYLNGALTVDESNAIKAWFNQSDEVNRSVQLPESLMVITFIHRIQCIGDYAATCGNGLVNRP